MLTLAIDTATAACTVALFDGETLVAGAGERVGRGHAERLVPMIAALPGGGRADHILVDVGPGSFTGIRVGIAAARGLGLGWGAEVAGYSSLACVAAAEFARDPSLYPPLAVLLEGGHGEVFMQCFLPDPLRADRDLASLAPDAARRALEGMTATGDGLRWLSFEDPRSAPAGALPDAVHALLLPAALRALPPRPLYGRAPDAKPQARRTAPGR
ncbi:MAG: tRNA (adenosine(37)-N6)-threonylcarbamoyltransferase complex dimerization subunit type 1 TsaB [Janthinobacterium lividum]